MTSRIPWFVALLVLAGPTLAEEGPRFGVLNIGGRLFAGSPPVAAEPATAAPVAPAAAPSLPPRPSVAEPTALLTVPTPRLRPISPYQPLPAPPAAPVTLALAVQPATPPPIAAAASATAMGTRIDPLVTGAIEPPEQLSPAAGSLTPLASERAPVAPIPPLESPAAVSDGLLGDPAAAFPVAAPSLPQTAAPQVISLPRPAASEAGGAAAGPIAGTEPYQLVRQLQALQDRTAQGSVEALAAQRSVIATIDRAFAVASPSVWQDARNAVAAVGFVLSGGPPTILKTLVAAETKPAVDERLLKGVLAYAEGRESEAYGYLTPLDAVSLAPSIAAQVAMAQSALAVRTDPPLAMRLLAVARLLAPGTLVEEAAIRRQIFVADQLRDDQAVQSLARQYLDRFRRSVYAGNFRERFAAALSHMDFINDPAQFPRLDDMLASVEPEARADLYLTIALAGVVNGRLNAARLAATRALPLTAQGSTGQMRARLYRAAVTIASAKTFDAAVADYAAIDRARLLPQDVPLAEAVGIAIAAVRSGTEVSVARLTPAGADQDQPPAVIARANDALKTVDTLLKVAVR
jgi:chemotaxis protein MotC